jgi:hypothetical protein
MRPAPSSGGGAGTRSSGVALSLARCSGSIGYGGADVEANGSKELKKYLGSVNGQPSTRRQAVLSGRVKRGERPKLQPLLTRSNSRIADSPTFPLACIIHRTDDISREY